MDACEFLPAPDKQRVGIGDGQDRPGVGCSGQRAHDKAGPDAVILMQFGDDFRCGHSGCVNGADDGGLGIVAERARFHHLGAGRAAQHVIFAARAEAPAFHRRAAGQPGKIGHRTQPGALRRMGDAVLQLSLSHHSLF